MNKPNRKFSPKQNGGERSERPRRPRTNDGSRAAGFSDKRYSPILDPDDNKEWKQRDEAGRRYRPAGGDNSERPRRPRNEEGPRANNRRGDDSSRSDFRKSGRDGYEGGNRFGSNRSESGERPRNTGERSRSTGEGSNFKRRDNDDSERGGYPRRSSFDSRGESPRGGDKPQYGRPRPRSSEDQEGGFKGRREEGGFRSANRSEGYGNKRREDGRPEGGRREDGRSEFRPKRSDDSFSERRSSSPTGRRGESRFSDTRGNSPRSDARPGGSARRTEGRFDSPRGEGRREHSRSEEGFEGRERAPFKKKDLTERKPASTSTPPTYDFSKIKSKEAKAPGDATIRLNKYIADAGICSRRDADELIASGQITVNGEVITQMGHKVKRSDAVTFNGKKINPEKLVYVLLNKPKDFITTTEDPQERKTVMQLVDDAADQRIYPVGRLDRNTTGLLLLTNDGELAERLSHPSHKVKKVYQVLLDKPLLEEDLEKIQQGVVLEDGPAPVDEIGFVTPDKTVVGVEIHIGRNRIVRRIFEHLGYEVLGLDRVIYAGLTKKDLPRSNWRYLSQKEVIRLKHFSS